ncbi:MAG: hypothetical protein A3D13_04735 [Planctomycetes bacterium RIFCSPHIGHO2_02_FULL_40_12]|nr:MAG: hypothetical protein A3D13_04735 [Planctomycetes bacterium RIFCSPHIGHO2_02_FULL_40_12]
MTIRLGIVGCGAIADDMHIPTALSVKQVQLVTLIDKDIEQCTRLANKFGVKQTAGSIEEIAGHLDAVIIATPPHVRQALAKEAFQHGLHVLCEKPLANTVAECETIIKAAREAERVLSVGHMFRFYPLRRQLPDLVKQHGLGKILRVIATEGKPYSWPTVTGYTVRRDMSPGGVMINAGIHTLDSLLWWFGDPADIRYEDDSIGGLESNVRLWMQFPDNVEVYFRQSRTCDLPYRICIEAGNGSLIFGTNSVTEYSVKKNGYERNHSCVNPAVDHISCWNEQLCDFAESIVQNRKPFVTGEEGMRVIRLIETCYALKRSRPLPSKAPIPGLTW